MRSTKEAHLAVGFGKGSGANGDAHHPCGAGQHGGESQGVLLNEQQTHCTCGTDAQVSCFT